MELTTPRLRIDALQPGDAVAMFGYRADPAVARFQGWRPVDMDEVAAFIDRQADASVDIPDSWIQRAIRLRDSGLLIGDLGIHMPAQVGGSVEFGISIAPAHQGSGLAGEVLQALFELIFGAWGCHRVHASVDPRNLACMSLLRKAGMRQEACHRESLWLHGEWVDDAIFALLASQWQAKQPHRG